MNKEPLNWSGDATKIFKGKVVEEITYLNGHELEHLGWAFTAPVIVFTDGTRIIASADDEGNESGALWTTSPDMEIIPRGGE